MKGHFILPIRRFCVHPSPLTSRGMMVIVNQPLLTSLWFRSGHTEPQDTTERGWQEDESRAGCLHRIPLRCAKGHTSMSYHSHKPESELMPTAESKGNSKWIHLSFCKRKNSVRVSFVLSVFCQSTYFETAEWHPESPQGDFWFYCFWTTTTKSPCFIDLWKGHCVLWNSCATEVF